MTSTDRQQLIAAAAIAADDLVAHGHLDRAVDLLREAGLEHLAGKLSGANLRGVDLGEWERGPDGHAKRV